MKRLANVIMLIACVVAAFSLTSCELNSVAKQMSGTWTGKSLITNDDQSKEHRIYFKFDYDEKSGKEGGTYIEVRDVKVEGYETPAGDNINITYTSYVEGIWAITENGELAMKPDLNTLKVVVSPNYKEIEQDIFSDLHTEYSLLYDKNVPFTDLFTDQVRSHQGVSSAVLMSSTMKIPAMKPPPTMLMMTEKLTRLYPLTKAVTEA